MLKYILIFPLVIVSSTFAMQGQRALSSPVREIYVTIRDKDHHFNKYRQRNFLIPDSTTIGELKNKFNRDYNDRTCNLLVAVSSTISGALRKSDALNNDEIVQEVLKKNDAYCFEIPE